MRSEPVCHPSNDNCFRVVGIRPLGSRENNTPPLVGENKDDEATGVQPVDKDEENMIARIGKISLGSPASPLLAASLMDPLQRSPPEYQQLGLPTGSPCWSPSALSTSSLDSSRVGFTPPVSLFTLCISPIINFLKLIVLGGCTTRDAGGAAPSPARCCTGL